MTLARIAGAALIAASALAGSAQVSGISAATRTDERSGTEVGFRSFHDRLAPYGSWINHPKWGAVWRPGAGRGFRPYRDFGHWEDTEDYGTVWVSDYSWGDIPFHYGRWYYDAELGWVWVPGYVWAPAWVVWRAGAGDIGWLPMPPWLAYDGYGAFPDDWNDWYGYASTGYPEDQFFGFWSFVSADDLFAPSISYYVIGPRYYGRFIRSTVGWTRFSIMNGHVVNRSIDRDRFRTTFGHELREGRRHDFERHPGLISDYASGKRIETQERGVSHVIPATESRGLAVRGSSSVAHHTTTTSRLVHHTTTYHHATTQYSTTTVHHTTTTHHSTSPSPTHRSTTTYRLAPADHPASSSHTMPGGSGGTPHSASGEPHASPPPPSHASPPSNNEKPH